MTAKAKKLTIITSIVLAFFLIVNVALSCTSLILDKVLGTTTFVRNEEDVDKAIANSKSLALQIEEEGIVLLENKNSFLPLSNITKVNLFGWGSYSPIACMVGSGAVKADADNRISLTAALKNAGISYNTDIESMYTSLGFGGASSTRAGNADYHIYEADKSNVDKVMTKAKAFSDIAIITLSRAAGESTDVPYNTDEFDIVNGESLGVSNKHYLELSEREKYLITAVCSNFDKVIVLLNNANVMELGYLDNFSQIKAVLNIGLPGDSGFSAIPKVLMGEVNPSGRTADTYAYDIFSAPATQISQYNYFTNYTMNNEKVYWVTYNEGIYVGYRYYETRYAGNDNDYSAQEEAEYASAVKYPFGYGLSYTNFSWKVERTRLGGIGGEIEVDVSVTNVGNVSGKDVVELYYTAPYTVGGIEKSFVNLGAFAKTKMLAPGESEVVTLKMNVDDMASYDYANEGCYVLEKGDYKLKLQSDSHNVKDGVSEIKYTVNSDVIYKDGKNGARSTDITAAVNHFEGAAIENMTDKENSKSYLSRADWSGTWPNLASKYTSIDEKFFPVFGNDFNRTYHGYVAEASANLIAELDKTWWEDYVPADDYRNKYYSNEAITVDTPYYLKDFDYADKAAVDYSARIEKNDTVKLVDMKNVPYSDNAVWDKFLGQMSYDDLMKLYQDAGYKTISVESIGKSATADLDGPAGVSDYMSLKNNYSVCWPNTYLICQTFNEELAVTFGQTFGAEALTEGANCLYAPAVNLHRSPFGGRNGEYPSEDPLLAGKIYAAEVRGMRETGLIVYVKHFALNNQETVRDVNGLATFTNEQTIRELYLKPFELCIKEGEATGLMNAYNRIGAEWCGMNAGLQIDVTRNEWGFEGSIVTDFFIVGSWADNGYMSVQMALKSGTDLLLTGDGYEINNPNYLQLNEVKADVYTQQALKSAAKHVCYAQSRGALAQIEYSYAWRTVWLVADIVVGLVIVALAAYIVIEIKKNKISK